MARRIRKFFQKNFEKRSADWPPEKKDKRKHMRQRTMDVFEVAEKVVNVPTGGKLSAILDLTDDAVETAIADPSVPEFDQGIANALKDPFMREAMELAQEFIDLVEEEYGNIPDHLEKRMLKRAHDALSFQYDKFSDMAEDKVVSLFNKGVDWFQDLFD